MSPDNVIQFIENAATEALRQRYVVDDSAHIAIEGLNLCFIGEHDYKVIVRCCLNNIAAVFEVESAIGLPNNPFYFNEKEAYAFAIYLVNVAVKIYMATTGQDSEPEILYDPSEPHGVC
jgi:hypothetical protein